MGGRAAKSTVLAGSGLRRVARPRESSRPRLGRQDVSRLPRRGEQLGDWDAERMCQLGDVEEGHVAERTLNTADVGSVQIRFFRQALLGPTSLGAEFANALRKPLDGLICD